MFGFSIEFKRWYIVVRNTKQAVVLCFGFANQLPTDLIAVNQFNVYVTCDNDNDENKEENIDY
jgi:hypothetical protein